MTHEELLYGIKELERIAEGMWGSKALRAVVELHESLGGVCVWCTCRECNHVVDYPCKTIQVIEKGFDINGD